MTLISAKDLSYRYDANIAVNKVSFNVHTGDYLCIIGENGSGKSTLMKGILGLITPCNGDAKYSGLKQTEIGYLPQQTVVQKDFPASVFEVILSGCSNRHGLLPFYTKRCKADANNNLNRLGISSLKRKSYRNLSGGQQQRVLLARALCSTNKILLLDEPVTGLDPIATNEMYSLLQRLNDDGMTIIMISHDIRSAVKYGNKILHLQTSSLFFGQTSKYIETDIYKRMIGECDCDCY